MEVVFLEPNKEKIANAFSRIRAKLDKKIINWGLTQNEKKAILARISGTTSYTDFQSCDFVIEAIRYDNQTGERQVDERKKYSNNWSIYLNLMQLLPQM